MNVNISTVENDIKYDTKNGVMITSRNWKQKYLCQKQVFPDV
jgi:hypothetical protein